LLRSDSTIAGAEIEQFGTDGVAPGAVVAVDVSIDLQGAEKTMNIAWQQAGAGGDFGDPKRGAISKDSEYLADLRHSRCRFHDGQQPQLREERAIARSALISIS
jgi:hypothetical protein